MLEDEDLGSKLESPALSMLSVSLAGGAVEINSRVSEDAAPDNVLFVTGFSCRHSQKSQ